MMGAPTLCLENWPKNFNVEKKSSGVPPPPPPPLIGPIKNCVSPHDLVQIDAHVVYGIAHKYLLLGRIAFGPLYF